MALSGGRLPYDETGALTGPARVLYGNSATAIPVDLWDVIPAQADAQGEYPAKTGWNDFGLAAEAPSYSHDKETEGIEYEQPSAALFEQISAITRSFTAQIAQIDPANMAIVENSQAGTTAIAAGPNESAQDKVPFGLYDSFLTQRIVLVTYRPSGAGEVTEVNGTVRSPAAALILPTCRLAAEESEFEFAKGEPVNAEITFTVFSTPGLPAGQEHGFWIFEKPGVITAV